MRNNPKKWGSNDKKEEIRHITMAIDANLIGKATRNIINKKEEGMDDGQERRRARNVFDI